jgi:hypothetical protein
MTQAEVAHELRCSVATVRNLIDDRLLVGVKLNHRKNAGVRIERDSFERYCAQIESEFAARLGGAA